MDVHRAAFAGEGIAPHVLNESLPREHLAPVFQQQAQDLELLLGQDDLPTVHRDGVAGLVHSQHAAAVDVHFTLCPAQQRPDAGEQLHHAEGLCQIVVRTGIQA